MHVTYSWPLTYFVEYIIVFILLDKGHGAENLKKTSLFLIHCISLRFADIRKLFGNSDSFFTFFYLYFIFASVLLFPYYVK